PTLFRSARASHPVRRLRASATGMAAVGDRRAATRLLAASAGRRATARPADRLRPPVETAPSGRRALLRGAGRANRLAPGAEQAGKSHAFYASAGGFPGAAPPPFEAGRSDGRVPGGGAQARGYGGSHRVLHQRFGVTG